MKSLRAAMAAIAGVAMLLSSCDRSTDAALERLGATESARGEKNSPEELRREIGKYQAEVDRTVKAAENLGLYYRLLGVEYLNRQMYGEALDALAHAIEYYPENEQITYYAGVAAARFAKAQTDPAEVARLNALAETYYKRTIFLYGDHRSAMFGLAVLYAMEMNRPADAVPLLEKVLARDTGNVPAKMLLARTHAALGDRDEAIDLYGEIVHSDVSSDVKTQALDNIRALEGAGSGATP